MSQEFDLTSEEYSALEPVLRKMSDNSKQDITLTKLFEDWTRFINMVEKGYVGSIYDYTNDLSTRNLIQTILSACTEKMYSKLITKLEPLDNHLKTVSKELKRPLLPNENWWWFRIPINLSDELKNDLIIEGFL
jgi:hypothetical protein